MLRVNRADRTLAQLPERKLSDAGILERHDSQAMIVTSPEAFFAELRENIKLLAQEFRPDDVVDDRIDLLGADEDGATVIIELKRGTSDAFATGPQLCGHVVETRWCPVH